MRVEEHPILGSINKREEIQIEVDGKLISALKGELIAAALFAHGIKVCRLTPKDSEPRGVFCGVGQCTDCMMTVDGIPNVRTCIAPVRDGMKIQTQRSLGKWNG